MATFVTYALLILDVLVIALLIQLVISLPFWLARRRTDRARADERVSSVPSIDQLPTDGFGFGARKRRCDDCRSGWVGKPGDDASVFVLRLRRAARRRAKRAHHQVPHWAERRGWDHCPSCFSTNVRDSRRQTQV